MHKLITFKNKFIQLFKFLVKVNSFIILLVAYLCMYLVIKITGMRFFPHGLAALILNPTTKLYDLVVSLHRKSESNFNRINLIELSLKNMRFKFTRTLITIGGMSVGIAAIVFLVSLGYGVEKLVTSRVARLEELKQADIQPQLGSNIRLNDKVLSNIKEYPNVKEVLPVIALVGKVNYKNSVSDMAVYGVTTEYLNQSAIKPVRGKMFESNAVSTLLPVETEKKATVGGSVAGSSSTRFNKYLENIRKIQFQIKNDTWLKVREKPSTDSKVLGFTTRGERILSGEEVYGLSYEGPQGYVTTDQEGNKLGKWISAEFLVWEQQDGKYLPVKESDTDTAKQVVLRGYIAQIEVDISPAESTKVAKDSGEVLGISATSPGTIARNQNTVVSLDPAILGEVAGESTQSKPTNNVVEIDDNWVLLTDEADAKDENSKTKIVKVPKEAKKEAVVNRAMLKVLGLNESDAIGKEFETSFVVTSALLDNTEVNIKSDPAKYKIVGVIPQDDTPFFYVPFLDLRKLGVTSYSQAKVISYDKEKLADIRQRVEASGFGTNSVVDTVAQIGSLFNTIRKILALLGAVALTVAALGMFNTLTVSLLERTREIGLMKAMGMKSYEVQELFLTESMVMGVFGGVLGLILGWAAGKGLSLLLSSVAVFKGVGVLDISYIPLPFILLIVFLSVTVGVLTGIYPARRATKISALNALRYE